MTRYARMLSCLLAAAACGGETAAPIAVVRDSAGVTIVDNRWAPESVAAWTVAPEPELDIGVAEGDPALQLFNVAGGAFLSGGRIAVVDGGTREVRIFDAGGAVERIFGTEGEGPGEFRQPALAGAIADTLFLYDTALRRATVWHPATGIVREFGVGGAGGGFPVPRGLFDDGSLVFGGGLSFSSSEGFPSGLIRQSSLFASVDAHGVEGTRFGEFPGPEMFARVANGGFSARGIPFGRLTASAARDSVLWLGTQDTWEIRVWARDGVLRRIVRVGRPAEPVTAELRARYVDRALADAEDEAERRRLRQQFDETPFGELVPPHGAIALSATGEAWVADPSLPGDTVTPWSVFDGTGRLIARVHLPAATRILDADATRLLVRNADDLGIEHVRVLRLER